MAVPKRILLGQLGRRGDCLYATAVARQIKHDYPGCELTWAISSTCRSVIDGNPFVDAVWEIPQEGYDNLAEVWNQFEQEARGRQERGEFNEVFFTQVHPGNFRNYDGTSRSSLFRGYPHPLTEPIQPIVRLSGDEIARVRSFVAKHNVTEKDIVILFECASTSGQSFVTTEYALEVASMVQQKHKNVKFVLSSNIPVDTSLPYVLDGSGLSFRENAELTKYCSFLIGCSSGISWLATSDWAKPIPRVQVLSHKTRMYASMIHDARYFGLPTDPILEFQDIPPGRLAEIVSHILDNGFAQAREKFWSETPVKFDFYISQIYWVLLSKRQFEDAAHAIECARKRFHYDPKGLAGLARIVSGILSPYLDFHLPTLKEDERRAFERIGYVPKTRSRAVAAFRGVTLLLLRSIVGENKMGAWPFLLDIVRHILKRST